MQAKGEQMTKLNGEDAIVGWPNAKETIIDQRDAYMARTLYAAATGALVSLTLGNIAHQQSFDPDAQHSAGFRKSSLGCHRSSLVS